MPPQANRPSEPLRGPVSEEIVTPDTPALGTGSSSERQSPQTTEPGSLLAMIGDTTPPHVAAATRLVEAARVDLAAGQTDTAVEKLERGIAIDPNNLYAYYFLARAHFDRRNYDQAVTFAEKAALLSTRLDPDWASRSYCLQARIYEASGSFADARASFTRALQADAGNRSARDWLARLGGETADRP